MVLDRSKPVESVFTYPPIVAIEILSPDDTMAGYRDRIRDYVDFGIENIWILDPEAREAWVAMRGEMHVVNELRVAGTPIYLPLPDIFEEE